MLEKIVVETCQSEVDISSPLGLLIRGPTGSRTLPADLPPWKPQELADQTDDLYMLNGQRPTVSCKQVIARDGCMSLAHVILGSQANTKVT